MRVIISLSRAVRSGGLANGLHRGWNADPGENQAKPCCQCCSCCHLAHHRGLMLGRGDCPRLELHLDQRHMLPGSQTLWTWLIYFNSLPRAESLLCSYIFLKRAKAVFCFSNAEYLVSLLLCTENTNRHSMMYVFPRNSEYRHFYQTPSDLLSVVELSDLHRWKWLCVAIIV